MGAGPGLNEAEVRAVATAYRQRWPVAVHLVDASGAILEQVGAGPTCSRPLRLLAITEARRWGEAVVLADDDRFLWAAPLMVNQLVVGGIVACIEQDAVFPGGEGRPNLDLATACRELREALEAVNATNAAALARARSDQDRERERAAAIHDLKAGDHHGVIGDYLRLEPQLLAAVRRGDRAAAVHLLNRVLVACYHYGGERLELVKSLLLELVVLLCRAAVEDGAGQAELLGANAGALVRLVSAADEEELAAALTAVLDSVFDALAAERQRSAGAIGRAALAVLRARLDEEDLDRSAVAGELGIPVERLTRELQTAAGGGFPEVLGRLRCERACWLLEHSEHSLLQVALDCGFKDASWFTKVFKKHLGVTPSAWRKKRRGH